MCVDMYQRRGEMPDNKVSDMRKCDPERPESRDGERKAGETRHPDQGLLLAMTKATTGANAHDVGEFTDYYERACRNGKTKLVELWEQSFNAFLSGRITPLRRAVAEIRYGGKPILYGNKNWWNEGA